MKAAGRATRASAAGNGAPIPLRPPILVEPSIDIGASASALLTADTPDAADFWRTLLAAWRDDIGAFAWDVFGIRLWRAQRRIGTTLSKAARQGRFVRMAIKSGQKTGKSLLIAIIALWWWVTRSPAKVVIMAPTGRQVKTVIWNELSSLWYRARTRLAAIGGLGGRLNQMPGLGLNQIERDGVRCDVIGFSANKPENAAGISGDGLLYLIDEASGIKTDIFEAIEGNRAGGAHALLFSNPTQTSGEFYDAFHANKSAYLRFTISSEETPNVITGLRTIPGLATRQWVLDLRRKWGPDYKKDPRYRVRVLGEFPLAGTNQIVTAEHIRQAHLVWFRFAASLLGRSSLLENEEAWDRIIASPRELEQVRRAWEDTARGDLRIGVDPAREGDDMSVIRPRRGLHLLRATRVAKCKGRELAGHVMDVARAKRRGAAERPTVLVDEIGIGSSPVDFLSPERAIYLIPVRSGDAPTKGNEDDFVNLRAQLHFGVADWIEAGGGWEPDSTLEEDLQASRYYLDKLARAQVEEKKLVKARLGRSPDDGDAAALSIHEPYGAPRRASPELFTALTKTRFQSTRRRS